MPITKNFGSFTATIEPNEDRPGVNCYISKGGYSASLACAEGEGYLHGANGDELYISAKVTDKIAQWAQGFDY